MGDGTSRGRRRYGIAGLAAAVAALWMASLGTAVTVVHAATPARAATLPAAADAVIHADIAAGGTVTYRLTGVLSANATGYIHNTVRIIPPPGVTDHGCSPKCSASAIVSVSPVLPVTG